MREDFREKPYQNGQKQSERLQGAKSMIRSKVVCFLLLIVLISMIRYGRVQYLEWKEAHSGIPDLVSSISANNDHYLKVVANSTKIDDKEEFARKVIHMCQDNSFRSVRFSTDINGYPSELDITVYLNRKAMEKGDAVCEIEFSTDDFSKGYDIKYDAEKFHLYLDGREIKFY